MLQSIIERIRQGQRTLAFPAEPPLLPVRFRGMPRLEPGRCPAGCRACADVCPVNAITPGDHGLSIDLGLCLFCPACVAACPHQAIFSVRSTVWRHATEMTCCFLPGSRCAGQSRYQADSDHCSAGLSGCVR